MRLRLQTLKQLFLGFFAPHILLLGLIVRDFHTPNILQLKFIRKFYGIILGLGFIITMGKSPFFQEHYTDNAKNGKNL